MRTVFATALGVLVAALSACLGLPGGPCVHTFREAVLHIVAARDSSDDTPVPTVVIEQVQIDGREQDLGFLLRASPSYGAELQGDSIICNVPCGFATQEGNYILTVSAPGYPAQDRGYEARYRVFRGGCPSFNDGGVRVTLRLRGE